MSRFVAVYSWSVPPEQEENFRTRWRETTLQLRDLGGLGSCLTRDDEGRFVAIALWPSEEARSKAFAGIAAPAPLPGVERLEEIRLQVEDDLWLNSPFQG